MKTNFIHIILILFLCSVLTVHGKQTSFVHTQTFKWNKKIWGTYHLKNEYILFKNGTKTWHKKISEKMSDIVFQGKNLIVIKEQKNFSHHSNITSESFRFLRKDKKINIVDQAQNKKLSKLFSNDVQNNLAKNMYRDGIIIYDEFQCDKSKKRTLTCVIKGRIKENVKQVTLK